jgi:hypothetical protein
MRSVTPSEAEFIPAQAHRPGGVSFRHLLAGQAGAPDNYSLSLVDVAQHYEAPRHRHNFEQVRMMLDGSFGFGPGAVQDVGSLGYFCEGTYYTQRGDGRSTTLLLQCGGASGAGYLGFAQLRQGIQALASKGQFHDGVFTWHDDQGVKHNQDGYEAAWEHVNQRTIAYPKPRYQAPVIVHPEHFAWLPWAPGLQLKRLGCFNERGLGVAMWQLRAQARVTWQPAERRELLYVLQGDAALIAQDSAHDAAHDAAHGDQALPEGSAIEVLRGESLTLSAGSRGCTLVGLSLPRF